MVASLWLNNSFTMGWEMPLITGSKSCKTPLTEIPDEENV